MKTAHEKDTIITIMAGCIIMYGIFSLTVFWMIALAIGIASITSNRLTHWIHSVWFILAIMFGYVISRFILCIIYIIVLLPIAIIAKLFRKDIMMIKRSYPSYFVERDIVYQPRDIENPW